MCLNVGFISLCTDKSRTGVYHFKVNLRIKSNSSWARALQFSLIIRTQLSVVVFVFLLLLLVIRSEETNTEWETILVQTTHFYTVFQDTGGST